MADNMMLSFAKNRKTGASIAASLRGAEQFLLGIAQFGQSARFGVERHNLFTQVRILLPRPLLNGDEAYSAKQRSFKPQSSGFKSQYPYHFKRH